MVAHPVAVGMLASHLQLQIPIFQDFTGFQIHGDRLTGAETTLFEDVLDRDVHHTGFRTNDDVVIAGDAVAGGAQTVAIERCADDLAIAKHQQRRAIPGFLHPAIVVVVIDDFRVVSQIRLIFVGFWNQQGDGF